MVKTVRKWKGHKVQVLKIIGEMAICEALEDISIPIVVPSELQEESPLKVGEILTVGREELEG